MALKSLAAVDLLAVGEEGYAGRQHNLYLNWVIYLNVSLFGQEELGVSC